MNFEYTKIRYIIKKFMAFNFNNYLFTNKKLECLLFKDTPYLIDN